MRESSLHQDSAKSWAQAKTGATPLEKKKLSGLDDSTDTSNDKEGQ